MIVSQNRFSPHHMAYTQFWQHLSSLLRYLFSWGLDSITTIILIFKWFYSYYRPGFLLFYSKTPHYFNALKTLKRVIQFKLDLFLCFKNKILRCSHPLYSTESLLTVDNEQLNFQKRCVEKLWRCCRPPGMEMQAPQFFCRWVLLQV